MQYEFECIQQGAGLFKSAHEKIAKEFKLISDKRVKAGWKLHSFETVGDSQDGTMFTLTVWEK